MLIDVISVNQHTVLIHASKHLSFRRCHNFLNNRQNTLTLTIIPQIFLGASFQQISESFSLTLFNHFVRIKSYLSHSPLWTSRAPCLVPCSCLSRAPACRPQNAHRYLPAKREGYSASPVAPRAAKGPHKNQNIMLASQLASTAELPL